MIDQVQTSGKLTPALAASLVGKFGFPCSTRELCPTSSPPILVYTDASDVPGRSPQRVLGAILFQPGAGKFFYTSWAVPQYLVQKWLPKKSFMGQPELLAAPMGFHTWANFV
jgi:hypothetical protein